MTSLTIIVAIAIAAVVSVFGIVIVNQSDKRFDTLVGCWLVSNGMLMLAAIVFAVMGLKP